MVDFDFKDRYTIEDLLNVVRILRHPGGCPWDIEQTHESLRRCFMEETCEVLEAIDQKNDTLLCEELGDVLLQVVFHASLAEDEGKFDLDAVADGVCKKMIFRHPHVFGNTKASSTEEVLVNWDAIKRAEKGQETYTDTLEAVARTLPALWRAEKVQNKAAKSGFNWTDISGAMDKLSEEHSELEQAVREEGNVREELGDVLFAAVTVARFAGIDPEDALNEASDKFISRFSSLENKVLAQGKDMKDLKVGELLALWDEAKGNAPGQQEEKE